MLKNAYLLPKIGADTANNEQHLAQILPIGHRAADRYGDRPAEDGRVAALRVREPLRERRALAEGRFHFGKWWPNVGQISSNCLKLARFRLHPHRCLQTHTLVDLEI